MTDIDADPAGVQVTLTTTNGSLSLASAQGITIVSGQQMGSPLLSFLGTTSAVNAAIVRSDLHSAHEFQRAGSD